MRLEIRTDASETIDLMFRGGAGGSSERGGAAREHNVIQVKEYTKYYHEHGACNSAVLAQAFLPAQAAASLLIPVSCVI